MFSVSWNTGGRKTGFSAPVFADIVVFVNFYTCTKKLLQLYQQTFNGILTNFYTCVSATNHLKNVRNTLKMYVWGKLMTGFS